MEATKLSRFHLAYEFNGKWHQVSQEEYDAIVISGPPHPYDSYSSDPTIPEQVHGAIWCMANRPGQTEPGASPLEDLRSLSVRAVEHLLYIPSTRGGDPWTRLEKDRVIRLRNKGYSFWFIGNLLKRGKSAVESMYSLECKRRGIAPVKWKILKSAKQKKHAPL